jgi:predicted negative regulator of RcsB-dependent stress response
MEVYSSEQEQIEAIKKWWRENGMAIVVGVAVGFGGLYGWKEWQSYVNNRAEQASSLYSQIVVNLDNAQVQTVAKTTDELIEKYSATPYASLAALAAAKVAAVNGDSDTAKTRLQWVIDNAEQLELATLARVRMARLLLLEKDTEAAASLLEGVEYPDSYAARVAELKGDLYALRGDNELARNAYTSALTASVRAQNQEMIQIKLDAIGPVVAKAETGSSEQATDLAE